MDPALSENNLYVELCNAVKKGDAGVVWDLLKAKKVNPNPRKVENEVENDVPLCIACKTGRMDIIRMLITNELYPANPNQKLGSQDYSTCYYHGINVTPPFLQAVYYGNVKVIKLLLSESIVKVELEYECLVADKGAVTALVLAVEQQNAQVVSLLLQARADAYPKPTLRSRHLPIKLAVRTGNVHICRMLLDAAPSYLGKLARIIPKNYATMHGSLEILQLLVKHGFIICDQVILNVVRDRHPDLLEYCLEHVYQQHGDALQWHETTMASLMGVKAENPMKQSDERCFAVLLWWGMYTARTPFIDYDEESALYAAFKGGAIKTMRMLVELRPSNLQERWIVEERIPQPPIDLSFYYKHFDFLEHNIKERVQFEVTMIEKRKNPCSLMILCRAKIIQSLGYKPFTKIPELPLPKALKDFVMLKDFERFYPRSDYYSPWRQLRY